MLKFVLRVTNGFRLAMFLLWVPACLFSQKLTEKICLNQSGFYPNAPKIAIFTGTTAADKFYITSTNLRDTFFSGVLGVQKQSAYSSLKTKTANFSSFRKPGTYVLVLNGIGHSYVFAIGNDVNKNAAIAVLKAFYYQRVSMPLDEKYAGKWHRSAGHPDTQVLIHASAASKERPEGTVMASPGGWYDAGDYNKYIVNSGITMGTLLSAYEDFPDYFSKLHTQIPETGNGVPDILNETVYNLRWMLTMQDPNDGGVYNKCTNAAFDAMVMPGITQAPRYLVQKGTAAALDFAAVTAQAARILQTFAKQLPGLADSCKHAALKAWHWALQNPAVEYNQDRNNKIFLPAITTGGYGDKYFSDEWFWAAAELYSTTSDNSFYRVVHEHINDKVSLPTWNNVAMQGYYTMLRNQKKFPPAAAADLDIMKNNLLTMANTFIEKSSANAFQTIMGQSVNDFNWGSNSNAANQGIVLINAYRLTGDGKYVDAALTNIDYVLGRNATGYSFITGIGSKPPMFPHHRQSTADGVTDPVPGLLVGGPNPGRQDQCSYLFTEPETAYTDSDCSYASNEIAINWNAPIVYLLNAVEALKNKTGYTGKK